MDNENFNDKDMPSFVLPESFLNQLFEFSGSTDGNRGFLLAFVNQEGAPMIYTKADNQIIEMGLRKAVERYILESEEAESYNGNDPI
jgi:hypothetical protein|tara:strand:+ start:2671 stop:2931 length:261 start_codon:yes stop_codon:yes gene_type:complete